LESASHPSKQFLPTYSSDAGRNSDFSEEQDSKALPAMRAISESTGNGELASARHFAKHSPPIDLTVDGRMIDWSSRQEWKAASGSDLSAEAEQNETLRRD
jgi:hypothetical protein